MTSARPRRALAHVAAIVLGVWLWIGFTDAVFQIPLVRVGVLGFAWLLMALGAVYAAPRPWSEPSVALARWAGLWLLWSLGSGLLGWRAGYSLEQWLIWTLLFALGGWVWWMRRTQPAWLEEIWMWMLGITLVLSALALSQWYRPWLPLAHEYGWLPPSPWRLQVTLWPHPNLLAAFLVWSSALVLNRVAQASTATRQTLGQGLLVAIWAALILTGSRGGWLAEGIVLGMFMLTDGFRASRLVWPKPRRQQVLTRRGLVGLAVFVGLAALLRWRWYTRAWYEGLGQVGNINSRDLLWSTAWQLVRAQPWTGVGLGNFGLGLAARGVSPPFFLFPHAHNLWLQIAAEMGGVGLLLFTAFWLWWLLRVGQAWRRGRLAPRGLAATAALFGGLVHGLIDAWWTQPGLWLAFILLLALSLPAPLLRAPRPQRGRWEGLLAGALALGVGWLLFTRLLPAYVWEWRGLHAALAGQWEPSARAYERAAEHALWAAPARFAAAYAWAQAAEHAPAPQRLWARAEQRYQQALQDEPYYGPRWAMLAMVQWQRGETDLARHNMRRAVEHAPQAAQLWVLLGWMEEQAGDVTAAARAYHRALALEPAWQQRQFFLMSAWRQQIRASAPAPATPECTHLQPAPTRSTVEARLCQAEAALQDRRWNEAQKALLQVRYMARVLPAEYWVLWGEWCRQANRDCHCAWENYQQAWVRGAQAPEEHPLLGWAVWPTFYGRMGPGEGGVTLRPTGFEAWSVVANTRAGARACGLRPSVHLWP